MNLSIVVVNWNGEKFLPACIKSIAENPPQSSYEIILVDNHSTDQSVKWLKSAEAKTILENVNFTLIESKENLGFSKANNLAIEKTNTPYVLLLNPDTIVSSNALNQLIKTLESEKNIGMVAPKLLNADGSVQVNAWAIPTATRILLEGLKLYKIIPLKYRRKWLLSENRNNIKKTDVPLVSGAAMMVKRKLIDEIGAFDSRIFMYGEDMEWCVRIGRNGWRIVLDPSAEVIHLGGQSSIQIWEKIDSRMREEEAHLKFQQDCFSPFKVLRNTSARIFVMSIYYFLSLVRRTQNKYLKRVILLQIQGFKKALSNLF